MKFRLFPFIVILFALLLSACGGTLEVAFDTTETPQQQATIRALETRVATLDPSARPLGLNSSEGDIRGAMLAGHERWQTAWVDAQVSTSPDGATTATVERVQLWVDRITSQYRLLRGPLGEDPHYVEISNGTDKTRIETAGWQVTSASLSADARNPLWIAPRSGGSITPHPLAAEMDGILRDLVFPAALAQRTGSLAPSSLETVAGRDALIVEYRPENGTPERLWLDVKTSMLLRWQTTGKGDSPSTSDVAVTALALDLSFSPGLFDLSVQDAPRYAQLVDGKPVINPLAPTAEGQAAPADFDPSAGELYFVVNRAPEDLMLARLPGACVSGAAACPEPQPIVGYPNHDNTIEPLVWSPDRTTAALVHQGTLYSYHAPRDEWKALAQFPIIAGPRWSRDGQRLAFTAQDDSNRQSLWVVNADGSDLHNLTESTGDTFSGPNTTLWAIGWLEDGRVLYQAILGVTATLYAQNADSSGFAKLDAPAFIHGFFEVAPDGRGLLIATMENEASALSVAAINGNTLDQPRRLGTFQKASISQILWSPDGSRVAFLVLTTGTDSFNTTVYTMLADGSDLRQFFQQQSIQRLTFTHDGAHLIADGTDNGRLFILPIDGGAPRMLEAPGLRLDQAVQGASWR